MENQNRNIGFSGIEYKIYLIHIKRQLLYKFFDCTMYKMSDNL